MRKSSTQKFRLPFAFAILALLTTAIVAQTPSRPPLMQRIEVQRTPTPSPGIDKTASSRPLGKAILKNGRRTAIPAFAELNIPGYSGLLVESLDGKVIFDQSFEPSFTVSNNDFSTEYEQWSTYNQFLTEQYTYFLKRLDSIEEAVSGHTLECLLRSATGLVKRQSPLRVRSCTSLWRDSRSV